MSGGAAIAVQMAWSMAFIAGVPAMGLLIAKGVAAPFQCWRFWAWACCSALAPDPGGCQPSSAG
jgi:hypothetical protein